MLKLNFSCIFAPMNRILLFILLSIVSLPYVWGGEKEHVLPRFECLDTDDGLSSNSVFHILQLQDGRMVVTTDGCINLYDGKEFKQYPCMEYEVTKIPNYHGAYHVYADRENRLWVKEWGNVWCMNLDTGRFVDLQDMQPMTDVFIDSQREVWIVSDTTVRCDDGKPFHSLPEWENLQDLDADDNCLYLFYSTGIVACYDRETRQLLYTSQSPMLAPFDKEDEQVQVCPYEDYENTSLVVRGADGLFYQLRGGKRYIFLCFNPDNREWRTIFETSTGAFHSLCVPDDESALIGCPTGVWSIGLQTGEMVLHSAIETLEGETWQTGINSVVCDDRGGLWLGSWRGVLKADTLYARPSYTLYYIVGSLGILLLILAYFFHRYATRQQHKEQLLMQRIQELIESTAVPVVENPTTDSNIHPMGEEENPVLTTENLPSSEEADQDFLARAIALVEQNLHTSGYTVERLAADLCMERTGLYRKLNAMVNQSPTLFMRSIRMKRAAQMLLDGGATVAEIAERTGFSSASYFSRLFQETYGCKPSEYKGNE